jgi:hypothetical protein
MRLLEVESTNKHLLRDPGTVPDPKDPHGNAHYQRDSSLVKAFDTMANNELQIVNNRAKPQPMREARRSYQNDLLHVSRCDT